jgi:hypothetical protein
VGFSILYDGVDFYLLTCLRSALLLSWIRIWILGRAYVRSLLRLIIFQMTCILAAHLYSSRLESQHLAGGGGVEGSAFRLSCIKIVRAFDRLDLFAFTFAQKVCSNLRYAERSVWDFVAQEEPAFTVTR